MGPLSDFGILELIFWLSAGMDKGKSGSHDEAKPCQSVSGERMSAVWEMVRLTAALLQKHH